MESLYPLEFSTDFKFVDFKFYSQMGIIYKSSEKKLILIYNDSSFITYDY